MKLVSLDRLGAGADWRPSETEVALFADLVAPLGRPDWHMEVAWADDAVVRGLNARFRDRDETTDVLSFSNLIVSGPGDAVLGAGENGARTDLRWEADDGVLTGAAGEIVIAPGFVARRCGERGWDFADELPLLVVHGALHLLGWEHEVAADAAAMREAERAALGRCGCRHPLLGSGSGEGDETDGR